MSKIGKLPVELPSGTTATISDEVVTVNGTKGELSFGIPKGIAVSVSDNKVVVSQKKLNDPETRSLYGLTRAMIANMVKGVNEGFEKKLELKGVGYKAQVQGTNLVLSVGFAHQVTMTPQAGVTFTVTDNVISVTGIDKVLVGDAAAKIRGVRPPEPYKGKGIRYLGEVVKRKAGKAAKAVGGK